MHKRMLHEQLEPRLCLSVTFVDSGQLIGKVDAHTIRALLGDLDGDGDTDAFLANSQAPHEIALNDGTGTFTMTAEIPAAGGNVNDAALADFDGDGDLDVLLAKRWDPHRVLLNNGHAEFSETPQAPEFMGSHSVAVGDVDGDSDVDLVWGGSRVQVWLNDGRAFFTHKQELDTGDGAIVTAIDLGDLDADGDVDAWIAIRGVLGGGNGQVWFNAGDGTFDDSGQIMIFGQLESPHDVALGDLDRDGDLDAFVAHVMAATDKVWINDGSGHFAATRQRLFESSHQSVALGDLDGDGVLDVFAGNLNRPDNIWVNDDTGYFSDTGQRIGNASSQDVALSDLDGDGDLDAFVAGEGYERIWLNEIAGDANLDGTFGVLDVILVLEAGKYLTGQTAGWSDGDWNGDGVFDQLDIVLLLQAATFG